MSLIVAYCGKDYQLWCSDGLIVEPIGSVFREVSRSIPKIVRQNEQSVLYGWSGEKYDAETILDPVLEAGPHQSEGELLKELAHQCRQVNSLSMAYSLRRDESWVQTGILAGGYISDTDFLAIITPDGEVIEKKRYAAIGIGAEVASKPLAVSPSTHLQLDQAYELLLECFKEASRVEFVGPNFFPFIVTRNLCMNLSKSTSIHRASDTVHKDA